jgi:hypothetical protein
LKAPAQGFDPLWRIPGHRPHSALNRQPPMSPIPGKSNSWNSTARSHAWSGRHRHAQFLPPRQPRLVQSAQATPLFHRSRLIASSSTHPGGATASRECPVASPASADALLQAGLALAAAVVHHRPHGHAGPPQPRRNADVVHEAALNSTERRPEDGATR